MGIGKGEKMTSDRPKVIKLNKLKELIDKITVQEYDVGEKYYVIYKETLLEELKKLEDENGTN